MVESRGEEVRKAHERRRFSTGFQFEDGAEGTEGDVEVEGDTEDMEEEDDVDNDDNNDNNVNGSDSAALDRVEEKPPEGSQGAELPRRRGQWTVPIVSSSKIVRERLERGESPEEIADELHVSLSFVRSVAKLLTGRRSSS